MDHVLRIGWPNRASVYCADSRGHLELRQGTSEGIFGTFIYASDNEG